MQHSLENFTAKRYSQRYYLAILYNLCVECGTKFEIKGVGYCPRCGYKIDDLRVKQSKEPAIIKRKQAKMLRAAKVELITDLGRVLLVITGGAAGIIVFIAEMSWLNHYLN